MKPGTKHVDYTLTSILRDDGREFILQIRSESPLTKGAFLGITERWLDFQLSSQKEELKAYEDAIQSGKIVPIK